MRLIDAKEAEKVVIQYVNNPFDIDAAKAAINSLPTIDAVHVVRCGECKYFRNRTCKIRKNSWGEQLTVGHTDYCSDGDRKGGDG